MPANKYHSLLSTLPQALGFLAVLLGPEELRKALTLCDLQILWQVGTRGGSVPY